MKNLDLIGQRFNRLLVVEKIGTINQKVMWKCKCDCGNFVNVHTSNLRSNRVKSCGCYKLDKLVKRSTKHNQRHTRLYEVWKSLKQRCLNSNSNAYKNYGGRGITICEEWKNDFQLFYDWSMKNGYKKGLTIDRINNNDSYKPNNCRWVTRQAQANNTRTNRYIEYNGIIHTISEWSRILNISYSKLRYHLQKDKNYISDIISGK